MVYLAARIDRLNQRGWQEMDEIIDITTTRKAQRSIRKDTVQSARGNEPSHDASSAV